MLKNDEFPLRDFHTSLVLELTGFVSLEKPLTNSHMTEYLQKEMGKCAN